ncbi:MAG: hypothetical protein ACRCZF_03415 [Gemmataceae bacterium]
MVLSESAAGYLPTLYDELRRVLIADAVPAALAELGAASVEEIVGTLNPPG